jgi:hypothetical protein
MACDQFKHFFFIEYGLHIDSSSIYYIAPTIIFPAFLHSERSENIGIKIAYNVIPFSILIPNHFNKILQIVWK